LKIALVTAGHHRLGAAIAARLAEAGWALALHSRKAETPDAALAEVLAQTQVPWQSFVADLADEAAVAGLIPEVATHFGAAPSLIVNNASRFDWDDAASLSQSALMAHFAVNTAAPALLATALAHALPSDARGCVVNILDQRIRQPGGDQLSYTVSKLALSGATEALARALAPKVRVNAVAPGLVIPTQDYSDRQMAALKDAMPLGLLPRPADVADAVAWLANAPAVTGQTLFVDGGAALKSFERDFLFLERDA
jgi:NAD(P)-dependent dehydrogenase (short-subunit alcohol dehydrogenase family)